MGNTVKTIKGTVSSIGIGNTGPKKLTTKDALKMMGEYFELDKKKVKFFIRQLEMSGKI